MKSSILGMTVIALAAVAVFSGCKHKGAKNGTGLGDDDVFGTPIVDAESGIPLDGQPFDQTGTLITDSGIQPVYFGYDSSVLAPEEYAKVQAAADYMNANGNVVLIVEGHCDERGSNEYNLSLGEQRALELRTSLVSLGIDASRIQSRSFGEEKPAVAGSGEASWSKNRRGEFAFYK